MLFSAPRTLLSMLLVIAMITLVCFSYFISPAIGHSADSLLTASARGNTLRSDRSAADFLTSPAMRVSLSIA